MIILSDGIHDPDNRPPKCGQEIVDWVPKRVRAALENLKAQHSEYSQEVWLFLVIFGAPPLCVADLETEWMGLYDVGLNTIRIDSDSEASSVAVRIFESLSKSRIVLAAQQGFSATQVRKVLDKTGTVEVSFEVSRPATSIGSKIQSTEIEIRRAVLENTYTGRKVEVFAREVDKDREHSRVQFIDTSNNRARLKFSSSEGVLSVDPYSPYALSLELGGNAVAQPLELPITDKALAHRHIIMLQWMAILGLFLAAVYIFISCRLRYGAKGRHVGMVQQLKQVRSHNSINFLAGVLVVVALPACIFDPQYSLDLQMMAAFLSLMFILAARCPVQATLSAISGVWSILSGGGS